jgi:hypothetical protein
MLSVLMKKNLVAECHYCVTMLKIVVMCVITLMILRMNAVVLLAKFLSWLERLF